jgi:hypothetical protein
MLRACVSGQGRDEISDTAPRCARKTIDSSTICSNNPGAPSLQTQKKPAGCSLHTKGLKLLGMCLSATSKNCGTQLAHKWFEVQKMGGDCPLQGGECPGPV